MPSAILANSLPVLAGVSFAACGVSYQAAERRGVPPVRLLLFMAFGGAMLFAVRSAQGGESSLSAMMLAWAAVAGLGQYGCMKLVGIGMRVGPFSGLWCMLAMNFAPVIVFAAVSQGVVPTWPQSIAVSAALLCCVIASTTVHDSGDRAGGTRHLAYGALLLAVLILNALLNMGLQRLAGDANRTNQFLCVGYVAIGIGCAADMVFARPTREQLAKAVVPGICAAAGSVCGMLAISAGAAITGPSTFLIASIVMLLVPMVVSVFYFREKPTGRWIATLALGLIAVALANVKG